MTALALTAEDREKLVALGSLMPAPPPIIKPKMGRPNLSAEQNAVSKARRKRLRDAYDRLMYMKRRGRVNHADLMIDLAAQYLAMPSHPPGTMGKFCKDHDITRSILKLAIGFIRK